ncbi:MAG: type III-B CRISPR module RAMP protein Cmr1 [Clostridia bacterium]|nr:MAG: type III-B CRISPR module RAMP protein Cmr1 [Clostridia bacterium]
MKSIKATFRVVTPLFMAGADAGTAELRAASVKGALRFWYRAIALGRLKTWEKVMEEEQEWFGSTRCGQARFTLRVEAAGRLETEPAGSRWPWPGSAYLGYGPITPGQNAQSARPYIRPGTIFNVFITLRPGVDTVLGDHLVRAIRALGLLGGLGSRSRRGFGSVALQAVELDGAERRTDPATVDELRNYIEKIWGDTALPAGPPEYTALSAQSRIAIVSFGQQDPLAVLDDLGREMMGYRSYGHRDNRSGRHILPWRAEAEQNFSPDHDLVRAVATGGSEKRHPERVVFGLPHNYHFSTPGARDVEVTGETVERRASPLFIHMHPLAGEYVAVLSLLPARFVPAGENILMKPKGGRGISVPCQVDFGVLHRFIDRFDSRVEVRI